MGKYSIKELEELSGIKAHTIRIWEQRYDLLTPKRTETNIRYYDDEELRKLLNIVTLLDNGHKISKIAKYNEKDIKDHIDTLLDESYEGTGHSKVLIHQMISAAINYDEQLFEKSFSTALLRYNLKEMYEEIIYPILLKVGLMWKKADLLPSQEHFLSNLFKQKLFAALDSAPVTLNPKMTWVLFLPETESHEIGLLISAVHLKLKGHRVIYLGQNVPYPNLKKVVEDTNPTHLYFFYVTHRPFEEQQVYLNKLAADFRNKTIFFSAKDSMIRQLNVPEKFKIIDSLQTLNDHT